MTEPPTTSPTNQPLSTPLADEHAQAGAIMTDFAGWRMPLRYGSELGEHAAVRTAAGMFDLSHMGQLFVSGPGAGAGLDAALTGAISSLTVGRAKYTLLCAPDGGVIDDLIVYRLAETEFLVIANAANRLTDAAHLTERIAGHDAVLADHTATRAMIAVQGPAAAQILTSALAPNDRELVTALRYYRCAPIQLDTGTAALAARTGYTGEDGFELMVAASDAPAVWRRLAEAGQTAGLQPCGLAARDTLRLEAAMPLYGHELDLDHTPYQAGLRRVVALDKDEFVGKAALARAAEAEPATRLVGLAGEGRRAARAGYPIFVGERQVGTVTSGALSPTLGHPIALAYVDADVAGEGTELAVDVRGHRLAMSVVATPFYRRT